MTLRFGLVGAGGIAGAYAQIFGTVEDAVVLAVADPDAAAAARLAARLDAVATPDVTSLLAVTEFDAVVVCTPPSTHPDIAIAAVDAGVAVLCEKPLAIRLGPAHRMLSAARAAGVPLTMATKFRFVADIVRARALVERGAIGELIQLENTFASRVAMQGRWNADPAIGGGGVLIDNGTHSVDIARYFLGPIRETLVVERRRVQSLPVEDGVELLLRAASGATATVDLSWSYDNAEDDYLRLYGTGGTIRIGWRRSEMRTNDATAWSRIGSGYDKLTCMRAQVESFCRALRGEESMAITDADAIASVQVIDAAYRSLAAGDWTTVEALRRLDGAGEDVA
ncbi:MAG: Gfo/Idh/MocA family protein [Acidimicrobiia bacterium]